MLVSKAWHHLSTGAWRRYHLSVIVPRKHLTALQVPVPPGITPWDLRKVPLCSKTLSPWLQVSQIPAPLCLTSRPSRAVAAGATGLSFSHIHPESLGRVSLHSVAQEKCLLVPQPLASPVLALRDLERVLFTFCTTKTVSCHHKPQCHQGSTLWKPTPIANLYSFNCLHELLQFRLSRDSDTTDINPRWRNHTKAVFELPYNQRQSTQLTYLN